MKIHIILAAVVGLSSLALLTIGRKSDESGLRDALAESEPINGDVQGLVQDIKTQAAHKKQEVSVQVMGGVAPQCLRLDILRIEDEYRFLYRGDYKSPKNIFMTGFVARAERLRNEEGKTTAVNDANLDELKDHMKQAGTRSRFDPYVSTSESAREAKSFGAWIYLIHTNRGVEVSDQLPKQGEEGVMYAQMFQEEREVAVPSNIPTEEIVGAWSWERVDKKPALYERHAVAQFGSFIKNPHYSGPLQLVGDICPPSR